MSTLATWFTPSLQTISRSSGRSAVAAAAYRACTEIYDFRTGITHDFTPKAMHGLATNIFVGIPNNDIKKLWNDAERAETRANSTVARELMLPLPSDWDDWQRASCTEDIANMIHGTYDVAVMASIHRPGRNNKNDHAHILFTTRTVNENGEFGKKTRILDDLKTGEVKRLREAVATIVNTHAQQNGNDWFVTAGKYAEHIQNHIPTHHISITHGKKQKKFIDLNRADVAEAHHELEKLQKQIDNIDEKITELMKPVKEDFNCDASTLEYYDVVNKRGIAVETMEEIKKRTSVGNLTDFWHPDSQETLEQKFYATQLEIEALDKREEFLRELLNSNYAPQGQVLTNVPPAVIAKPTEAIQPVLAPVAPPARVAPAKPAPVDVADLTLALNTPTEDGEWSQEQLDAAIDEGIAQRSKEEKAENAQSIIAQALGMTLAEYRKTQANPQQQHTDYTKDFPVVSKKQEQKKEDEHAIK